MKSILALLTIFSVQMASANVQCSAVYFTDEEIVDHGPVPYPAGALAEGSNKIPGKNRTVYFSASDSSIHITLGKNGSALSSVKLDGLKEIPKTITLDYSDATGEMSEMLEVTCTK